MQVSALCTFYADNFTRADFELPSEVTVVYLFCIPGVIVRLEPLLQRAMAHGARIVTYLYPLAFASAHELCSVRKGSIRVYGRPGSSFVAPSRPSCSGFSQDYRGLEDSLEPTKILNLHELD